MERTTERLIHEVLTEVFLKAVTAASYFFTLLLRDIFTFDPKWRMEYFIRVL